MAKHYRSEWSLVKHAHVHCLCFGWWPDIWFCCILSLFHGGGWGGGGGGGGGDANFARFAFLSVIRLGGDRAITKNFSTQSFFRMHAHARARSHTHTHNHTHTHTRAPAGMLDRCGSGKRAGVKVRSNYTGFRAQPSGQPDPCWPLSLMHKPAWPKVYPTRTGHSWPTCTSTCVTVTQHCHNELTVNIYNQSLTRSPSKVRFSEWKLWCFRRKK